MEGMEEDVKWGSMTAAVYSTVQQLIKILKPPASAPPALTAAPLIQC